MKKTFLFLVIAGVFAYCNPSQDVDSTMTDTSLEYTSEEMSDTSAFMGADTTQPMYPDTTMPTMPDTTRP